MKIFLRITFSFLGIWFLAHSIFIIFDGLNDKNSKADVAIVLGNKVNEDGTLSDRLKARLDKSIELYRSGRVKKIIVSGGLGKEGFWEANEMKQYLIENRVIRQDIIVDNFGNDTEKTVENSIKILDSLHCKKAICVSQYFHQTRTKMLFRKKGFQNIESVSPNYFEWRDFYAIFREFFAYYKELL